jgi:hypothetical protein
MTISRRRFATSLGAGFVLAPFLDHLAARPARAAGKRAKRVLLFCTMGTSPDLWTPTGVAGETTFTLTASTQPLEALRSSMVMVEGLVSGNPSDNHGSPDALTGLGFSYSGQSAMVSVDQFLGDKLVASGVNRPIATLLLGAETNGSGGKSMFNRGNNLPTIGSPLSAFNTVFGGAPPPVSGGTGPSPAQLLKRKKSILDVVTGEVNGLKGTLGASEKAKLDVHLESLRQIENRLAQSMMPAGMTSSGMCTKPAAPADNTNVLQADLLHMDVLVGAFACDITRVAAIQFGSDQTMNVNLPELGLQGEEHGGFIHGGGPSFTNLIKLEQWLAQRFVDLANKLKAIPEADGSGSLYDNTLMVWARDMGDAVNHNQKNMRFVFAGGAGGYLKTAPTGRYLRFAGSDPNDRHERALLNILDSMGITSYAGFGDPKLTGTGKTPLSGLIA